jgi:hypothetical protein
MRSKAVLLCLATSSWLYAEGDVALSGEALFWQANTCGLGFAVENLDSTTTITRGHLKEPDFNWNVGFRAGLDYKLPHDNWDLQAQYTYLPSTAHKEASAPQNGALFPVWLVPQDPAVYATHGKAHWSCNLNMGDLELGRVCRAGKRVSIRPHMGVRGGTIQQNYHINYRGGTVVSDHVKMSNDFWGIGLRFGFNSLWGFGKGISLYADGAGSLLSGHFHVHQREDFQGSTLTRIRNSFSQLVPIAEIALGLQWDTKFHADRQQLGIKLGWEMQYYWDQGRLIRFLSSTSIGSFSSNQQDLSYMGVTLGLRWDF